MLELFLLNVVSKYILYCSSFCPFSRKIEFFLDENGLDFQVIDVKYWLRKPDFIRLNPAGEVPVLRNVETGDIICDSFLICSYIDEMEEKSEESSYFDFIGNILPEKYEIQRLHMWFDKKFYNEVTKYIIEETFLNSMNGNKDTNMIKINVASANLERHIKYMEYLLSKRKWLACEVFTIADMAAAAQLSVLDYQGYIDWEKYKKLKEWYITVKSKKGFRRILYEKIPGFKPSKYYSELDF